MARILVIEDDPVTAAQIVAGLHGSDHDVVHLSDGNEALELATREPFDAVTLDRMLPGLDGLTLVSRLREAAHLDPRPDDQRAQRRRRTHRRTAGGRR